MSQPLFHLFCALIGGHRWKVCVEVFCATALRLVAGRPFLKRFMSSRYLAILIDYQTLLGLLNLLAHLSCLMPRVSSKSDPIDSTIDDLSQALGAA